MDQTWVFQFEVVVSDPAALIRKWLESPLNDWINPSDSPYSAIEARWLNTRGLLTSRQQIQFWADGDPLKSLEVEVDVAGPSQDSRITAELLGRRLVPDWGKLHVGLPLTAKVGNHKAVKFIRDGICRSLFGGTDREQIIGQIVDSENSRDMEFFLAYSTGPMLISVHVDGKLKFEDQLPWSRKMSEFGSLVAKGTINRGSDSAHQTEEPGSEVGESNEAEELSYLELGTSWGDDPSQAHHAMLDFQRSYNDALRYEKHQDPETRKTWCHTSEPNSAEHRAKCVLLIHAYRIAAEINPAILRPAIDAVTAYLEATKRADWELLCETEGPFNTAMGRLRERLHLANHRASKTIGSLEAGNNAVTNAGVVGEPDFGIPKTLSNDSQSNDLTPEQRKGLETVVARLNEVFRLCPDDDVSIQADEYIRQNILSGCMEAPKRKISEVEEKRFRQRLADSGSLFAVFRLFQNLDPDTVSGYGDQIQVPGSQVWSCRDYVSELIQPWNKWRAAKARSEHGRAPTSIAAFLTPEEEQRRVFAFKQIRNKIDLFERILNGESGLAASPEIRALTSTEVAPSSRADLDLELDQSKSGGWGSARTIPKPTTETRGPEVNLPDVPQPGMLDSTEYHDGTNIPIAVDCRITFPVFESRWFNPDKNEGHPRWRQRLETLLERFELLRRSEPQAAFRLRQVQSGVGAGTQELPRHWGRDGFVYGFPGLGTEVLGSWKYFKLAETYTPEWALRSFRGTPQCDIAGNPLPGRLGMSRTHYANSNSAELDRLILDASRELLVVPGAIGGQVWQAWPQGFEFTESLWIDFVFEQSWFSSLMTYKAERFTETTRTDCISQMTMKSNGLFPRLPQQPEEFAKLLDGIPSLHRYPAVFYSEVKDFVGASIDALHLILGLKESNAKQESTAPRAEAIPTGKKADSELKATDPEAKDYQDGKGQWVHRAWLEDNSIDPRRVSECRSRWISRETAGREKGRNKVYVWHYGDVVGVDLKKNR